MGVRNAVLCNSMLIEMCASSAEAVAQRVSIVRVRSAAGKGRQLRLRSTLGLHIALLYGRYSTLRTVKMPNVNKLINRVKLNWAIRQEDIHM